VSQPFGLEKPPPVKPRALPWAEDSHPFGVKTGRPHFTFTVSVFVVSLPRMSITLTTTRYSPGSV